MFVQGTAGYMELLVGSAENSNDRAISSIFNINFDDGEAEKLSQFSPYPLGLFSSVRLLPSFPQHTYG